MCSSNERILLAAGSVALAVAFAAVLLAVAPSKANGWPSDGRIMIIGGCCDQSADSGWDNADVYDPRSNSFMTHMPSMHMEREGATAIVLRTGPNAGKIFVLGGSVDNLPSKSRTTEFFDPVTNRFDRGPNMTAVHEGPATITAFVSQDGHLKIFVGGACCYSRRAHHSPDPLMTDPDANKFIPGPPMNLARDYPTAIIVPSPAH